MFERRFGRSVFILIALAAVACTGGPATKSVAAPDSAEVSSTAASTMTGAGEEPAAMKALPGELIGSWILIEIDGEPVIEVGKTPAMEILEDGSVGGVGGVNRFNTRLEIVDGRIKFGPVAATKMAGPPEAMELEDTFLARLGAVSTYQIKDGELILLVGDDEALRFKTSES